jgi:hypothetical protein
MRKNLGRSDLPKIGKIVNAVRLFPHVAHDAFDVATAVQAHVETARPLALNLAHFD